MNGLRRATEQLPARHAKCLAFDVPQRHIERAHGTDSESPAARHQAARVEFVPKRFGLHGIFAKQHFFKSEAKDMSAAGVDHSLRDPGVRVDFANPGDAFVGVNEHDDIVLRRRACLSVEAGIEEYVGFDSSNFQGTMIS